MLSIDHVIVAVLDPVATAARLRRDFGLGAVRGGLHPGGTGNWTVPLEPPQYLELLYVADHRAAAGHAFGRRLLELDLAGEPLVAWAMRTDDIDAVGRRLDIEPEAGSVRDQDGTIRARWRSVEAQDAVFDGRPFFVEYDDPENLRPGLWGNRYRQADHDCEVGGYE